MSVFSLNDCARSAVLSIDGKLKIRVVEQEELPSVLLVMSEWDKAAKLLYIQAHHQKSVEAPKYLEAQSICSKLARRIDDSLRIKITENSYIGCYDAASDQLQGIMLLSSIRDERKLYICYLLTNPIHISSSLSAVAKRIHGVGASLINAAEKICVSGNYTELFLLSDASAKGFYTYLGFREKYKSSDEMFKERRDIMMTKATHRQSIVSAVSKEDPQIIALQEAPERDDQERKCISSFSGSLVHNPASFFMFL